jgi:hypothetical protein
MGLCVLKVIEPALYLKAKVRQLSYEEVKLALGFTDDESWDAEWWRFGLGELRDDKPLARFSSLTFQYNLRDPSDIVPFTANAIIDSFKIEAV